jgi:hypothetical protein
VLALALVGFNLGVELGQITTVAIFLPLAYLLRRTRLYRNLLPPSSILIDNTPFAASASLLVSRAGCV